jgi:Alr-MurF fusion protein
MLTWVEIDLEAIRNNTRRLLRLAAGAQLMAVVKANAYGHGAVPVARAALAAGAHWLGVARYGEGLELRRDGLQAPLLVMGYTPPEAAAESVAAGLSLAAADLPAAQALAAAGRAHGRPARVHVKLDSGMGRYGLLPEDVLDFVRVLRGLQGLEVEGLFTHLSAADTAPGTAGAALTNRQFDALDGVLAALDAAGLRPPLVHAGNSAGIIAHRRARHNLVRAGIALYGLHPSSDVACPPGFAPALAWKARLAQVKTLPPGHAISYGPEYVTAEAETVALLPVGYADGYRRVPKGANSVLIHGQLAPIRGRVCMDQVVAGVSHIPNVRPGDEAVLLGRQGEASISAEELARRWGTINYDVTSGVLARVERRYVG